MQRLRSLKHDLLGGGEAHRPVLSIHSGHHESGPAEAVTVIWIHPLFYQPDGNKKQKVVLLLLQCKRCKPVVKAPYSTVINTVTFFFKNTYHAINTDRLSHTHLREIMQMKMKSKNKKHGKPAAVSTESVSDTPESLFPKPSSSVNVSTR